MASILEAVALSTLGVGVSLIVSSSHILAAYKVASVCFVEMDYFVAGDAVSIPCVVIAVSASDILVVDFVYFSLPVFKSFFLRHNKRTDPQRKNPK